MIAMSVLGLLLYIIYSAFVPAMRKVKIADAQCQTQQSALVAYQKIFNEVSISNPRSFSIVEYPAKSLSFLSNSPFADSALPGKVMPVKDEDLIKQYCFADGITWTKMVILFRGEATAPAGNKVSVLCKKEIPYNKGGEVCRLVEDSVSTYLNDSSYPTYVMALNIDDVSFSAPRYPCILVELTSSKSVDISQVQKDKQNIEGERYLFSILPRN